MSNIKQYDVTISELEDKINQTRLRINTMRNRSADTLNQINKNRELVNRILLQKQQIAIKTLQIEKEHQRLKHAKQDKIKQLKLQNNQKRKKSQQQIRDIKIAMYLVKVDDVKQAKKLAKQHEQKRKKIEQQILQQKQQLKQKVLKNDGKGKQVYWRQKLLRLKQQNQLNKKHKQQRLKQKNKQLQNILTEQKNTVLNFSEIAKQANISKRKYLSALSLPIKKVAHVIQKQFPQVVQNPELFYQNQRKNLLKSQALLIEPDSRFNSQPHMDFSLQAQQSQQKLKIVLDKIKKKQPTE